MEKYAFKMRLNPGQTAEYKKRHDEIWPELAALLHETGISNYSIFRDGLTLFGYLEIDDVAKMDDVAKQEIVQKWWTYMEPLMECNSDNSPIVTPLEEAFYMA